MAVFRQNDRIRILATVGICGLRIHQYTLALPGKLLATAARKFLHAMKHRLLGQDGSIYLVKALHYVECFHDLLSCLNRITPT